MSLCVCVWFRELSLLVFIIRIGILLLKILNIFFSRQMLLEPFEMVVSSIRPGYAGCIQDIQACSALQMEEELYYYTIK